MEVWDGSTDLTQTNQLIGQINETLTEVPTSGDFTNISSGDIMGSLDFEGMADPYDNFWVTVFNGLQTSLTCTEKNSVDLDFLGKTYTLYVSDFNFNYPTGIRWLLTISCSVGIIFAELKLWRKISIMISSGQIMKVADNFARNDISDVF